MPQSSSIQIKLNKANNKIVGKSAVKYATMQNDLEEYE